MKRYNKFNNNKKRGAILPKSSSSLYYQQLMTPVLRVLDLTLQIPDSANGAYDLHDTISLSNDFIALKAEYGLIKFTKLIIDMEPYFPYSALATDQAVGAFGVRQGVFDNTVTVKNLADVSTLPGSILVTNKTKHTHITPIFGDFFASNLQNTQTSDVPKVNFYFAWDTLATTNTDKSLFRLKLVVLAKSKLE